MDRLEFLKRLGMLTVGASLVGIDAKAMVSDGDLMEEAVPEIAAADKISTKIEPLKADVSKPITVVVIGAGVIGGAVARKLTEDGYILFSDEEIEAIDNEFNPNETASIEDLL